LKRFERELTGRPVWLFSSGPLEDWPTRRKQLVLGLPPAIGAAVVDHHVFAGRLDRRRLGVAERLSVGLLRAPDGDFRPWDDVIDWARHIGGCLTKGGHRAPPPDGMSTHWPLGIGASK
jgi:menaquinone-dependent protoporphyrinogen oxidase